MFESLNKERGIVIDKNSCFKPKQRTTPRIDNRVQWEDRERVVENAIAHHPPFIRDFVLKVLKRNKAI